MPLLNEAEEASDLQDVSFFPSPSLSLRIVPCCHVHIFMRLFGEADVEGGGDRFHGAMIQKLEQFITAGCLLCVTENNFF